MRKLFIALAFATLSASSFAQETDPTLKYSVATNGFWSNWFVSVSGIYSASYSDQEKETWKPWEKFRRNGGVGLAIGKWHTPVVGWRIKGQGIWGKSITNVNTTESYKYWNAQFQPMANLVNLFGGYNQKRWFGLNLYAGVGVARNMSHDNYYMSAALGLQPTFRLGKVVSLFLDFNYNIFEPGHDNVVGVQAGKGLKNYDRKFNGELGLTFNLGKSTWENTPDVDAIKALSQTQIDALNSQLADEQAESNRLRNQLREAQAKAAAAEAKLANTNAQAQTVKEVATYPSSVFFNINKSTIASRKDLQNVKEIAQYAKDNDAKIVVTGYADSKTGSAAYNQKLSEKRAETVKKELVKMGVKEENIETVAAGGVKTLSPISYNRRATVQVK